MEPQKDVKRSSFPNVIENLGFLDNLSFSLAQQEQLPYIGSLFCVSHALHKELCRDTFISFFFSHCPIWQVVVSPPFQKSNKLTVRKLKWLGPTKLELVPGRITGTQMMWLHNIYSWFLTSIHHTVPQTRTSVNYKRKERMHMARKATFEITGKKEQGNLFQLHLSVTMHIKDGWSLSYRSNTRINSSNKIFQYFLEEDNTYCSSESSNTRLT